MKEPRIKFRPKYDKIVELLLYLAHKRPNADHYQAVKLLYLADKEHLNKYGRPITFERYCALRYGPVASNALDLLKNPNATIKKRFAISELPFETEKLGEIIYIRSPKRAVNYDIFSVSDLKVADYIINKYGHYSFDELYKLTHEHFAYKTAWEQRGTAKRADMRYDDMIDESSDKASYIAEIEMIAPHV